MSDLSSFDKAPVMAGKAEIEILSHELFVASRRVFGDVFPYLQATVYQETYDIALPNDNDSGTEEEGELEFTARTKTDKVGAIAVTDYSVAVASFSPSPYEDYKLANVKQFEIDAMALTASSTVDSYLYAIDENSRKIITLSADIPRGIFPDGEQPRNRPRFNRAIEQVQTLYVKDLEYIYICLRKAGCMQGDREQE